MAQSYAMSMKMILRLSMTCGLCLLSLTAFSAPDSYARGGREEQDAARKAMLDGNVMPFSVIKRRVERQMRDSTYLGSEFHKGRNCYRLKYIRDGKVVWVDVDGRTGEITGWAH